MFKKVDTRQKLPEMEKEVLKFWEENKVFEKSLAIRKNAKKYSFYDGPPFATGTPHYGHIVASVMKDVVPRYWTMRGYYVERKWGWDCHGLPIENIVEKEMGSQKKKDIEEVGVEKFNEMCRSKVLGYVDEWKKVISRLGRWADMENAYKTMDLDYMESVWWVFKELWDRGLVYEDYRSMHICPRCETTLSQSEVSEGYKDVKDLSVIAKFRVVEDVEGVEDAENEKSDTTNKVIQQAKRYNKATVGVTYILAWTTTPWTLPGNVALAVNKSIKYQVIRSKQNNENYIVAKSKVAEVFEGHDYEIIKEMKGSNLVGLKYKPLWPEYAKNYQNSASSASSPRQSASRSEGWQVYDADFVTTEEGTGVVHIAPAFGEDDMKLGKEKDLPFVQHVGMDGVIDDKVEAVGGLNVKPIDNPQATDVEVIKYLAGKGLLFHKEKYEHSYPHCWRCDTPLINYATSSWFIAVTKIKEEALKLAKEINWTPENMKEGRFGNWLEGARDWSISRQRFWASVMPIWVCDRCNHKEVFGSAEGIEKKLGTFFVMRHGEAEHNVKGILSEAVNDGYNLTKKGEKEVKEAGKKLIDKKIDLIISSDLDRAKQTSAIISKITGAKVVFDERLRDIDMGDYTGKKQKEIKEFLQKWVNLKEDVKFPNGDSWETIKNRVQNFYNDLITKHQNKRVLVVSHGDTIISLKAILLSGNYFDALKKVRKGPYVEKAKPIEMDYKLIDLHKHVVDKIKFGCDKCDGTMHRIPDVLDTWFDSGSMPYAQKHYPFENEKEFEEIFPADFIAEGVDQTRAWFYYLHIIATGIKNKIAFKNVIVNGIVLAEDGKKMSKKLQNYPDPSEMFEKYGADAVRYYLMSSPVVVAQNLNFSEKEVAEITRGMMRMLWNSYSFFVLYANIDKFSPEEKFNPKEMDNSLDKWIVSELHILIKKFNQYMEKYELHKASRLLPKFVDNLSNWYIRRSRKRFWKSENDNDKNQAYATLHYVLIELSKVMAPFTPFIAEEIYSNLRQTEDVEDVESVKDVESEKNDTTNKVIQQAKRYNNSNKRSDIISVHLEDFPEADENLIDEELNRQMQDVRDIIQTALQLRTKAGMKVRQPLAKLTILPTQTNADKKSNLLDEELVKIIKEEVNGKNVEVVEDVESVEESDDIILDDERKVALNTEITEELKLEGQAREIIRCIQQMRKEADYEIDNRIRIWHSGMSKVFDNFGDLIAKETLANKIEPLQNNPDQKFDLEKEFEIDEEKLTVAILLAQ